jgi:flagellar biosynthetic protein FliR
MGWDLNNWMMVFVRACAFLSILPIFTMLNVPAQVRVMLAVLLAILIAPTLPPCALGQTSFLGLVAMFVKEALCGLLIGFVSRMIFFASDFAGHLMASELGLNLSSILDPANAHPTQAPNLLLFILTCLLMMSLDMHHWLLSGFQYSYTLLPIGGARLSEVLFNNVVDHTSRVFLIGVQIAAPMIACSMLALVLLGFLGRLVPQMNVFAESFSVRLVCGLVVLAFTLEISAQHIVNGLHRMPEDFLRVAQFLGGGG